jgi:hypothetical protein
MSNTENENFPILIWEKKKIVQVLEQVAETSLDAFFFFFSRPLRPKYFSGIISQYGASESLMAIHIPFIFQLPRTSYKK